jgi:hypothetical protein
MPVANLKSKWTSGNLVFTGTGAMHFGVDDDGIDVKFFGAINENKYIQKQLENEN